MKKSRRRAGRKAKGNPLSEAELEQAVGGVALQEASPGEQGDLLKIQMAMQQENQVFTSVSNVLKARHDTVKNSNSNVR